MVSFILANGVPNSPKNFTPQKCKCIDRDMDIQYDGH